MSDAPVRVDLHLPGDPVRRDVPVRIAGDAVRVEERSLALEELVWSDRRAGLFLLFTDSISVALGAAEEELDDLARRVRERVPVQAQRRRLEERLGRRDLRLVAGCAVAGRLGGEAVHGLRLAALDAGGLHLLGPEGSRRLAWPAEEAAVIRGRGDRRALRVRKGGDVAVLHYLTEEERETVVQAAREEPSERDQGSLEMFRQKDVAPPPAAEVPELSLAAESLHPAAEEAAARIPDDLREDAGLGPHFFATHFLELGEVALGPLLLRKSAASGSRGLGRALEALDATELQEDTRAAVIRAVERLVEVYHEELERVREERKAPRRVEEEMVLDRDGADRLAARVQAPFDKLAPRFRSLRAEQDRLASRLEELAEGPPGSDDAGVGELAERWRGELRELDKGYREAWSEAVREIGQSWESLLLPRLGEVAELRRRRIPEWVQLALLGLLTFLVVGAAVLLLGG